MLEKLTELHGEIITVAADPASGRVVACTDRADAKVIRTDRTGDYCVDEVATPLVVSLIESLAAGWRMDLQARCERNTLYLAAGAHELKGGGSTAVLALDLDTGASAELLRGGEYYPGSISVAVVGQSVLTTTFDGQASGVTALKRPEGGDQAILRLGIGADGRALALDSPAGSRVEEVSAYPLITHLLCPPDAGRVWLVTLDPGNGDGNRVISLPVDAGCRPLGPPETAIYVYEEPYSPSIGGACIDPHTGEAACLMYSSEWEKVVPLPRIPRVGDPLPVADLHLVRPGSASRRIEVNGRLGVNAATYDRQEPGSHPPERLRIGFDFGGARSEVTPIVPVGPNRYLIGLFGGTLLSLSALPGSKWRSTSSISRLPRWKWALRMGRLLWGSARAPSLPSGYQPSRERSSQQGTRTSRYTLSSFRNDEGRNSPTLKC